MAVKKIALLNPPHQFTVIDVSTESLYSQDFNNTGFTIPHVLNAAEARSILSASSVLNGDAGLCSLVADPFGEGRGTVFRIDLKEGAVGLGTATNPSSIQAHIPMPGGSRTEVYMSFDIGFLNSYIFSRVQKTMSIRSNGPYQTDGDIVLLNMEVTGSNPSIPPPGPVNPVDGNIAPYLYYSTRGADRDDTNVALDKGTWNRIEMHVKLNSSPGVSDGEAHVYKNSENIYTRTGIPWVGTGNPSIEWTQVILQFWSGGAGSSFAVPQNQSIYLDNIIISANPITH